MEISGGRYFLRFKHYSYHTDFKPKKPAMKESLSPAKSNISLNEMFNIKYLSMRNT